MHATDFIYDGVRLSDTGFMICSFSSESGTSNSSAGSNIEFHTVSQQHGEVNPLISSEYSECFSTTITICKNTDVQSDTTITESELRQMMLWLNRRDYNDVVLIDDARSTDVYELRFRGSFNVDVLQFAGHIIGLDLHLRTNKPFAVGQQEVLTTTLQSGGATWRVDYKSDSVGSQYPHLFKVTCRQAGNLSIVNKQEDRTTYVGGCTNGEVITFDCENQIITTSNINHKVCNDFNFVFPRLYRSFASATNEFTVSLPCSVEIRYNPIIKAVV